jgi:hypothetical protein
VRRDFQLCEEDSNCLDAQGYTWDALVEANVNWIILRGYLIPAGYNTAAADAAIRIPPSYPDGGLDMVYFFPALSLVNGRAIAKLTPHPLEGKQYQQWSRHYPWEPGLHTLCTHLLLIRSWLEQELRKAA